MAIYLGTQEVSLAGPDAGYMRNSRIITTKTYSFNLGQTNYASLTPTTTAQNLTLPTTTYTTTAGTTIKCYRIGASYDGISIEPDVFDYTVVFTCKINYNYGSNNVASTLHGIRSAYCRDFQFGHYYKINSSNGQLSTTLSTGNGYITSQTVLLYQKADNSYASSSSYGIYHSGSTIASVNTSNKYIELQMGAIAVRAHDSYCPVSSLQLINPTNTIVTGTWTVYEGLRGAYSDVYDSAYSLAANT